MAATITPRVEQLLLGATLTLATSEWMWRLGYSLQEALSAGLASFHTICTPLIEEWLLKDGSQSKQWYITGLCSMGNGKNWLVFFGRGKHSADCIDIIGMSV